MKHISSRVLLSGMSAVEFTEVTQFSTEALRFFSISFDKFVHAFNLNLVKIPFIKMG